VRFEKGEPICHIWPLVRGALESVETERPLSDAPDLKRQYDDWNASWRSFNAKLKEPGSDERHRKWQKLYHRGLMQDGSAAEAPSHRTRLR
jgi:hypothetical protein